jgi:4'-phosphopantetheinyl transferase
MSAPAVQIFLFDMDADRVPDGELNKLLAPDEMDRARQFRFGYLTRRYRVGRARLRLILGEQTGLDPSAIEFSLGPLGKPMLADGPSFNVSHSGGLLMIGIAPDGNLGVDIEIAKPKQDLLELAEYCFSSEELRDILKLQGDEQRSAFYRIWTRKEAVVKADGGGLSMSLRAFSVMSDKVECVADRDSRTEIPLSSWVKSCPATADSAAAVAWDRPDFSYDIMDLRESAQ